jgi:glyoxylase-like metal-dependent hydrolase (beta-lactamase superfamily II)
VRLGAYDVTTVAAEWLRLDGGAMFGVVPRPLWERTNPPDEKNRIQLAARVMLLRGEGRVAIVDAAIGGKDTARFREIYAIDRSPGLEAGLEREGVLADDVTDVILTHLHFDHAGGATRRDGDRLVPTFPRAAVHVQRGNLRHAREPNERDRASYLADNVAPLEAAGVLREHDPDDEILPGVFARVVNGHTPGQQMIALEDPSRSGACAAVFPCDLVPMTSHLPIPYVMGYDLEPLVTMREKTRWLPLWAEQGSVVVFAHDPEVAAARIALGPRGAYQVAERVAL